MTDNEPTNGANDMELDKIIAADADGRAAAASRASGGADAGYKLPDDVLVLLPVRNMVMFPGLVLPVTFGRPGSIAGAQAALKGERPIGLVLQRKAETDSPGPDDLYRVGTASNILRYVTTPDGSHHVVCQGQERFRILEFIDGYPFLAARVARIEEPEYVSTAAGTELEASFM